MCASAREEAFFAKSRVKDFSGQEREGGRGREGERGCSVFSDLSCGFLW